MPSLIFFCAAGGTCELLRLRIDEVEERVEKLLGDFRRLDARHVERSRDRQQLPERLVAAPVGGQLRHIARRWKGVEFRFDDERWYPRHRRIEDRQPEIEVLQCRTRGVGTRLGREDVVDQLLVCRRLQRQGEELGLVIAVGVAAQESLELRRQEVQDLWLQVKQS